MRIADQQPNLKVEPAKNWVLQAFNVFVERLETMSGKRQINTCLSALRNRMVHGLDPYSGIPLDDDLGADMGGDMPAAGTNTS